VNAPAGQALTPAATPRLRLRRFSPGDRDDVVALHRDPRVRTLLVDDHPLEQPARAAQLLLGLQRIYQQHPGLGIWHAQQHRAAEPDALAAAQAAVAAGELAPDALRWLQGGRWLFCGWFSLMPMSQHPQRVEIGCRLLPQAWGSGLVLEGGQQLLDHAFGAQNLAEVWAACHPEHRSVKAVLLTLGFVACGRQPYENAAAAELFCIARDNWMAERARPLRERRRAAVRVLAEQAQEADACTPTQPAWG
jgi:RimJ/RimL family protein N-acetyltransferase